MYGTERREIQNMKMNKNIIGLLISLLVIICISVGIAVAGTSYTPITTNSESSITKEIKVQIKEFDRVEIDPNSVVHGIPNSAFDTEKIKLIGNWTNYGKPAVLTFTGSLATVPSVDITEATGVKSTVWNESKTTLTVVCDNAPIAITPATLKLTVDEKGTLKATSEVTDDTIEWSTSSADIVSVDKGELLAKSVGIATVTAKSTKLRISAACIVTVVNPAKPDPIPTPAPVKPDPVTKEKNPITQDKGVSADVKPVTPEVTEYTTENVTALKKASGLNDSDLIPTATGEITISPIKAKVALEYVTTEDPKVGRQTVVTLPIVTAVVSNDKIAALAFKMTGAQLGAKENSVVGNITFIKVLKDGAGGAGAEFVYTTDPTKYADKSCVLKNAAGTTLALTDKILPTETYTFVAFIKDNREFDYASAAGVVIDPIMAAVAEPKATKSSSSGCNAGFAALALLAIVPVVCRRKK